MNKPYPLLSPGTRLRSYDFESSHCAAPSYMEGAVVAVHERPYGLFYEVFCDYCNYIGRAGMTVQVPVHLDHHDFDGRLLALTHEHPQLCLNAQTQFFYYLDTIWSVSKKDQRIFLFQRDFPDRYCWEISTCKDAASLWHACISVIDSNCSAELT